MNAHFQLWENQWQRKDDDDVGPKLRSSNEDIDDWVIDSEGINIKTTNQRRLSRYCIEQLWITENKTKLLVLIKVADDVDVYGGIGAAVEKVQRIERANISGREYYRLKCTVTSSTRDKLVFGEGSGTYSREQFERDVGKSRNGDFGVAFDGTNEKMLFNWYSIITEPSSLMFFGAPLTQSRAFDSLWKNVKSNETLYTRFACMYDEFEGDVEACQALYNSYLFRRMAIAENKLKDEEEKRDIYNGDLLRSNEVVNFLSKIDSLCEKNLMSVFTDFKNHAEPIIPTTEMCALIAEAPNVFGQTWNHLCDLRGVQANQPKKEPLNVVKRHQVFWQLINMARTANRRKLMHLAFISSVANFARGVTNKAESAFAYFGNTLSISGRKRIMAKLTGDDAEGRVTKNTLADKQRRVMRVQAAIVFAYDNYQRGMKLQHQRGAHSSAFFKGTHQCAHKVNIFDDTTFDQVFAEFKMFHQPIPSPWGMPVFEFVEEDKMAEFFMNYNDFESDTTPDFTGKRVEAYLNMKDISRRVQQLKMGFVPSSTNVDYFDQCPASMDRDKMMKFSERFKSKEADSLMENLKHFQVRTVRRWNPKIDEPSLSIYLGLLGIDEAASKECGSITLDLLLRSGILEETEEGSWSLADDWENRRVYLFGDAKTIENMSKFVKDMQDRKISYTPRPTYKQKYS